MRTIFLLILLIGVGAGFVYPWAVTNFSGREIGVWQGRSPWGSFWVLEYGHRW